MYYLNQLCFTNIFPLWEHPNEDFLLLPPILSLQASDESNTVNVNYWR